ncbi:MAG: hypothetical protein ACI88A_003143 [Paraglaciecola sp.]|jgi:hypothetical protein
MLSALLYVSSLRRSRKTKLLKEINMINSGKIGFGTKAIIAFTVIISVNAGLVSAISNDKPSQQLNNYVVQGKSIDVMVANIHAVGGVISHKLPIIKAIGANLTDDQYKIMSSDSDLRFFTNHLVSLE